jgi:THO complex subunit 3
LWFQGRPNDSMELAGHVKAAPHLEWSCDGSRLLSGSDDRSVLVWDVSGRGAQVGSLQHNARVDALALAPHSPHLLVSCADKKCCVWDLRSKDCPISVFTVSTTSDVLNCAWHTGGNLITTGNKDDVLAVADLRKSRVVKRTKFAFEVNEFRFAEGGSRIVASAGPKDGAGSLAVLALGEGEAGGGGWSLSTVANLVAHTSSALCVALSPDERRLALGAADSLVSLWSTRDMVSEGCVGRLEAAVHSVSISHDSQWVASAPKSPLVDISDAATGAHAETLTLRARSAACVRFHPTSPLLAYSTSDKPASARDACVFVRSMSPSS